jgi:hypothetical protein
MLLESTCLCSPEGMLLGCMPLIWPLGLSSRRCSRRVFGRPVDLLLDGHRLWMTDFHGGTVWVRENLVWRTIARGLKNPTALALGVDGSVFVADFGGDTIVQILG